MSIKIRMLRNWFDGGVLLFKAGELYDESPAALAQVKRGNAERVDAADQPAAPAVPDGAAESPAAEAKAEEQPAAPARPGRKPKA